MKTLRNIVTQSFGAGSFGYARLFATVLAMLLAAGTAVAATNNWNKSGVGATYNWDDQANWDAGASGFPNAVGDVAIVSQNIWTTDTTINLNQQITVGSLTTGDTSGGNKFIFAVGTSGSLVFQTASGNANLIHTSAGTGQDNINCPIILNSTLALSISNGSYGFARVSGNGGIIMTNTGTLWLSAADNSFAGDLVINKGQVVLQQNGSMPSGSGKGNVFVGSGAILSPNNSPTINGLSGSGTITVPQNWITGTKVITIGANDQTSEFSGVISNGCALIAITKTGAGTMTLSGTNSYTGATGVNAGKLLVNGVHTGGGTYTVASGATLGGSGMIACAITLNSGARLAPGGTNGYGTLTASSNLNFTASSRTNVVRIGSVAQNEFSQLRAGSGVTVTLGGTLSIDDTAAVGSGTITLVNVSALGGTRSGVFSNYPADGATYTGTQGKWTLHYGGGTGGSGDVTLTLPKKGTMVRIF